MKTLQEVLNTDLSPDRVRKMTANELGIHLMANGVIESGADMNCLIIEGVQRALNEGDEFPIKYYTPEEEMPEENKIVDPGECLTDNFIESIIKN